MKILGQIRVFLLGLFAFFVPVYQGTVCSLLIGLFFILSCAQISFKRKIEFGSMFICGLGLFLAMLLSVVLNNHNEIGWKILETSLSFLAFPLAFFLGKKLSVKEVNWVKLCFIIGLCASAVYRITKAAAEFFYSDNIQTFFYSDLSKPFHAGYLSMYFVAGLIILAYYKSNKGMNTLTNRGINGLMILFGLMIWLLSSKTGIITAVLVLVGTSITKLIFHRKSRGVWFSGALTLLLILLLNCYPKNSSRFKELKEVSTTAIEKNSVQDKKRYRTSTSARMVAWSSSLELITMRPMGYGLGNSKTALLEKYLSDEENYMAEKEINSHNQFLETTLALGIPGLLLLLFMFFCWLTKAWLIKDFEHVMIILILGINLMTESMFLTQAGTIFIAFIVSLYYNASK